MRVIKLLLLLIFSSIGSAAAEGLGPYDFWNAFRKTSPFPLQDFIASPISPSGDAVVILTEPPARVWSDRESVVKAAFDDNLVSMEVHSYPVGYDGWVRDIVLQLRNVDQAALAKGMRLLSEAFHGTAYGASYRTFEPYPWYQFAEPGRHLGPSNLRISAASLNNWLFQTALKFVNRTANKDGTFDQHSRAPVPLSKLFDDANTGIFFSITPGLVLLVFDRNRLLNEIEASLRQFSLDSDALVGAVAKQGSTLLALVGRERTTSVSDMPPLRVDTILTLAAATEEDLAQSFERNAPLAGPTSDVQLRKFLDAHFADGKTGIPETKELPRSRAADWAPILLSRELTNTEYGQLLNITDQMLKGWSMADLVAYGNFPYPAPTEFPHPNGIFRHLKVKFGDSFDGLTFNWNTAGFGAWTEFDKYQIYTVLNSNALPISYIPDAPQSGLGEAKQSVIRATEDEYGQYFAHLRDPNLNRVAQYSALHVIFTHLPVKAVRVEPLIAQDVYDQRWDAFKSVVQAAVRKLAGLQSAERPASTAGHEKKPTNLESLAANTCGTDAILRSIFATSKRAKDLVAEYGKDDMRLAKLADAMVDRTRVFGLLDPQYKLMYEAEDAFENDIRRYNSSVSSCRLMPSKVQCSGLRNEKSRLEERESKLVAWKKELDQQHASLRSLVQDGQELVPLLPMSGDCRAAWQSVHNARPESNDGAFTTPSIVVSTDVEGRLSGGHNLNGRSLEVIPDSSVAVGSFRPDGGGKVLRLNPDDISKSTTVAREFERSRVEFQTGDAAAKKRVEERIAATLKSDTAPAKPFTAAALAREGNASATRGLGADPGRHMVGTHFFDVPEAQLTNAVRIANETQANLVAGSKDGVYSLIDPGPPPVGVAARSPADMLRLVEAKAAEAAHSKTSAGDYVIVSDGTLSIAEMDGIRVSAETRQLIATAGGGGGNGLPPGGNRIGMFFGREPGGTGRGGKDSLIAFPFGKSVHGVLRRVDADWAKATLDHASVSISSDGKSMVGRLQIPFKTVDSPMLVQLKAFFTSRQVRPMDLDTLKTIVGKELENVPDGTMIGTKLADIKRAFNNEMRGDAQLQSRLRLNDLDFFVVEIISDAQGSG